MRGGPKTPHPAARRRRPLPAGAGRGGEGPSREGDQARQARRGVSPFGRAGSPPPPPPRGGGVAGRSGPAGEGSEAPRASSPHAGPSHLRNPLPRSTEEAP